MKMKYYYRVTYTEDYNTVRDAVVGVDDTDLESSDFVSFKQVIQKIIETSLPEKSVDTNVCVRQIWSMGADVDFINI